MTQKQRIKNLIIVYVHLKSIEVELFGESRFVQFLHKLDDFSTQRLNASITFFVQHHSEQSTLLSTVIVISYRGGLRGNIGYLSNVVVLCNSFDYLPLNLRLCQGTIRIETNTI